MLLATLRLQLVSTGSIHLVNMHANHSADDVKDIYRRAEGHELVVEGLRGDDLVAQE